MFSLKRKEAACDSDLSPRLAQCGQHRGDPAPYFTFHISTVKFPRCGPCTSWSRFGTDWRAVPSNRGQPESEGFVPAGTVAP